MHPPLGTTALMYVKIRPLPAMNARTAYEFGLQRASHMDGGEQLAGYLQEGAPYSQGQLQVL